MLQRRKPPKMKIREETRVRSQAHLKFVRGFVCAIMGRAGHECEGKIEAHHVSEDGNAGMGIKAPDSDAVPLCSRHHAEGHRVGWETFAARYGVDLLAHAAKLWRISPHNREKNNAG